MTQKTYYYHFQTVDNSLIAMLLGFVMLCFTGFKCPFAWGVFVVMALIWIYKKVLNQKAIVITDKDIKIDHCEPLAWKDIKNGEIKEVRLFGRKMKILALYPKKGIKYRYNYLQLHNVTFGPFAIPLYGVLTAEDEKEILKIIKKHIKLA